MGYTGLFSKTQWNIVKNHTVYHFTVQYSLILYSTIQSNTVQCNAVYYYIIHYNALQYRTVQLSTVQFNTVKYCTIQYHPLCNTVQYFCPKSSFLSCINHICREKMFTPCPELCFAKNCSCQLS